MAVSLEQVCCACFPRELLGRLSDLRRARGIRVANVGDQSWVVWDPGEPNVLDRILPIPGVQLFARRAGSWYRAGEHLPAFDLPLDPEDLVPISRAVVPCPITPITPQKNAINAARLRLAADPIVRPTSAMRCDLKALGCWADLAPTSRLTSLRAARDGTRVVLLGSSLPEIPTATRFWGDRVLSPLGFRPQPALAEAALLTAFGIADDEIVILAEDGIDVIPRGSFQPLTRAGVRLALQEEPTP